MTTNRLYHKLMQQIEQILPNERVTRRRLLAWLMTCLFVGRNPYAARLGNKIPGQAKKPSKAERLRRWLKNKHVHVRRWYEPLACQLITQALASGHPLRLIVDGTRIGNRHQLLMVAIAYRRRALPLAWTWVRCRRGHSSSRKQIALLKYVHSLIPANQQVQLAGDSEFGAVAILQQLDAWSWQYVLRQKGRYLVSPQQNEHWLRFDALITQVGQTIWLPNRWFTKKHAYRTTLLGVWRRGETHPWLLVTNIPNKSTALRLYTRRMWIEEMFGDLKSNGFDLETIRFRHFLRLSRFTLAAALLYVWLIAFGAKTIKQGNRHLVDRNKQRQLSIFRIGFDMLERCLINGDTFSLRLIPYF